MDWPSKFTAPGSFTAPGFSFHRSVVDRRSTFVKHKSTTDLLDAVQRSTDMGAHKKSPPVGESELVDVVLRKQVAAKLATNDEHNTTHKLKKGDPNYRIANHQDLHDATGVDKNLLRKMFGGKRTGSKPKKDVMRSRFVGVIRHALGIPQMATIEINAKRAAFVKFINDLPDEQFATFETATKSHVLELQKKPE